MNKIKIFTMCLFVAIATGCVSYTPREGAEMSSSGVHFIVRNIFALDDPKTLDMYAKDCMENSPEWEAADAVGRERLMEVGREKMRRLAQTHEQVSLMDVGVFWSHMAYPYLPKGSVRVGDEVEFRVEPMAEAWNGITCPNRASAEGTFVVDRIVKHYSGTLLYSNGKFMGTAE